MFVSLFVHDLTKCIIIFRELKSGVPVADENGVVYGESVKAAQQGITAVTLSRVAMAAPGMVLTPVLMSFLEKKEFLKRFRWANSPIQVLFCGLCLTFATPLCCALFSQKAAIAVSSLEPEIAAKVRQANPNIENLYYNKGL